MHDKTLIIDPLNSLPKLAKADYIQNLQIGTRNFIEKQYSILVLPLLESKDWESEFKKISKCNHAYQIILINIDNSISLKKLINYFNLSSVYRIINKSYSPRIDIEIDSTINSLKMSHNRFCKKISKTKKESKNSSHKQIPDDLKIITSSLAHELNNPLGALINFIQLILNDLDHNDPLYNNVMEMQSKSLDCKRKIEELLSSY